MSVFRNGICLSEQYFFFFYFHQICTVGFMPPLSKSALTLCFMALI